MDKKTTIKEQQPEYRPDERFLKYGGKALTAAELLAIVIRTGSKDETSVELSKKILYSDLTHDEDILKIFDYELEDLQKIKGVGRVKALQIKAVAELSGRISRADTADSLVFSDPEKIAGHYMEQLRHLKKEIVILLLLNSACELIKEIRISEGTVNASLFSPREIFLEALRYEAVNIILLHNHPSGNPAPSEADIKGTLRVQDAGRLTGITLLDHIIIGDRAYISLREKGYLNE